MTNASRDMILILDNPMEGLKKKVKNIWCRPQSKGKDNIIIEFVPPRKTHVMPIIRVNRNVAKSLFEIEPSHKWTHTCWDKVLNSTLKSVVRYWCFWIWYPIIYWWTRQPWEMINQVRFWTWTFAKDYTQRWAAKLGQWRKWEWTMSMATCQQLVNGLLDEFWRLKGWLKIFWGSCCRNPLKPNTHAKLNNLKQWRNKILIRIICKGMSPSIMN